MSNSNILEINFRFTPNSILDQKGQVKVYHYVFNKNLNPPLILYFIFVS